MATVVSTRPQASENRLKDLLEQAGHKVIDFPCLYFAAPEDNYEALDTAIKKNHEYEWVFFLSQKAAEVFFSRLLELGGQLFHLPPHLKIAAVGKKTAKFIEEEINFPVDFVPSFATSEQMVQEFKQKFSLGGKILIPRTDKAESLKDLLEQGSVFKVDEIQSYRSVCPELNEDLAKKLSEINSRDEEVCLSFASSQTARNFFNIADEFFRSGKFDLSKHKILSIGPETSKTLQELMQQYGLNLAEISFIEAREPSFDSMVKSI